MEGSTQIRLQAYLAETGTKAAWLAGQVGVSRSHMNSWLHGRKPVPDHHRLRILAVLRRRQIKPLSADLFDLEG